jgi:serpin B
MVDITMPKFGYEWGDSLKTYLQSLGMTDAFIDGRADFSGINGLYTLVITDVFHKAFIAVDEKGTEAAAATAIVFGETAVPQSAEIVIDRPFLFFIQHDDTGTILFMGKVGAP